MGTSGREPLGAPAVGAAACLSHAGFVLAPEFDRFTGMYGGDFLQFFPGFFKRSHRSFCLCGRLRASAEPGLPQAVEQVAHARDAAVFHAVFTSYQPRHIGCTPSAHTVSPHIRRRAATRLERCHLPLGQPVRPPRMLPFFQARDAILVIPPHPAPQILPADAILRAHPRPTPPQHHVPYRQ
jgi:hypothetical protein